MTDYTIGADKGFHCTFWCWVLSDGSIHELEDKLRQVLMHLLVLGTF